VAPDVGGGLARFDWLETDPPTPLFRACPNPAQARPFDLGCNLLVPWCGRVAGGGFSFGGRRHKLPLTVPGEALPIHGDGLSSVWQVEEAAGNWATLVLPEHDLGPYRYAARVTYTLADGGLRITLEATHAGGDPLPYGLGLHPWFRRTPGTRLHAPSTTVTLENSRHLPAGDVAVAARPDWDFNAPRHLPRAWINNEFAPWPGRAEILWDDLGVALDVDAVDEPRLRRYLLYSPASDASFWCFEPVTHAVDAHNAGTQAEALGLVVLHRGETLRIACKFSPKAVTTTV